VPINHRRRELGLRRTAALPAEAFAPVLQAFGQPALREGTFRVFGIDLRVVEDAESTGSMLNFSAISSIAISSAIRPGCLTRRAHRVAFGEVEAGESHRGHAVCPGVEQARLTDRGLGRTTRQIARPALMADGGELAFFRSAKTNTLDCRGRCVVLLIMSGRGSATFTGLWTARAPAPRVKRQFSRNNFPPKTATDVKAR